MQLYCQVSVQLHYESFSSSIKRPTSLLWYFVSVGKGMGRGWGWGWTGDGLLGGSPPPPPTFVPPFPLLPVPNKLHGFCGPQAPCLLTYTSIPPPPPFSPSLISLVVSVDVKHHVHLLTPPYPLLPPFPPPPPPLLPVPNKPRSFCGR